MFLGASCASNTWAAVEALDRVHRRLDDVGARLAVVAREAAVLADATQWESTSARRFGQTSAAGRDDIVRLVADAGHVGDDVRALRARLMTAMWDVCQ